MRLHKSILLAAAPLALLGACSENAWNDHLEGFEVPPVAGGISTAEYVLTADDYKTLAGLDANKAIAAANGEEEALAAIGANGSFESEEQATKYLPALLESTKLPYFTYNNESAVKLTYNVASQQPQIVKDINAGTLSYTVSEADYQNAWGSDENFINAFSPATPAASFLPNILKQNLTAENGAYALVSYNNASINPVFGDVEENYNEISSLEEGQNVKVHGVVTAIQARGFVLSDETGSILCYQAADFDPTSMALYSDVIVSGMVGSYNKGLQIAISAGTYEVTGIGEYTYPTPRVMTGADMDAAIQATDLFLAQYVQFSGRLSVSGNYFNINVPGATTAIGSIYQATDALKASLKDATDYTFTGYFISISGGKYFNVVVTDAVEGAPANVRRRAPLAEVSSAIENALYRYDGSAWKTVDGVCVLNPADYTAMGFSYANMSPGQPEQYLPILLKNKYPYAAVGDTKTVVFTLRTDGVNNTAAREFELGETGEWQLNAGRVTSQFVKMDGTWKFNPSVVLTLPYARNTDPSYTYYMACVEWVYENICVPMGDTSLTSGKYFIDYRGNAEFYSGASAYYGNVDVRAASALSNMPEGYTGYEGLDNDQITELMKKRFCTEVLPGAMHKLHADAKPIPGMDVTYTINFTAYDGAASEQTVVYLLTGEGEFTFMSTTWVDESTVEAWKK